MFSKGTFQRYFFEIEQTQKRLHDLYGQLSTQIKDPIVCTALSDFLCEMDRETRELHEVRTMVDQV